MEWIALALAVREVAGEIVVKPLGGPAGKLSSPGPMPG